MIERGGVDSGDYPDDEHRVFHALAWSLVARRDTFRELAKLQQLKRETDDEHGDERRRIIRQLECDARDVPAAEEALADFHAVEERASDRGANRLWNPQLGRFVTDERTRAEYSALKKKHRAVLGSPLNYNGDSVLSLALSVPVTHSYAMRAEQLQRELSERQPFPDTPTDVDIDRLAGRLRRWWSKQGFEPFAS